MKRQLMLAILLLCVSGVSGVQALTLKIATISPDGTSWMQEMRAGAEEISKQTRGRVKFKFYPGGVMGNDTNVLRKIRIGQLHGGAVTAGSLSDIYSDIDIYGLPYLFKNYGQVDHVRKTMDRVLVENLEKKGFVSFGLAEGGFSYMMSNRPLRSVDDVRAQKVWIPTGHAVGEAVFRSADVAPVNLPLSDVLTGLQTGLVDTVITSPIGAIALQWHTRVKYVVDMPLTYFSALLVIDSKSFDRMKPEDRGTVRKIMTETFRRIDRQNRKDNLDAREALVSQGIEFVQLPQDSLDAWSEIGSKAVGLLEQDNSFSRENFSRVYQLLAGSQ